MAPPERQADESLVEYASRLVAAGHGDESIRYQMSLSAETVAAMDSHLPENSLQTLTRLEIGLGLAGQQPRQEIAAVGDDLATAAENLEDIRDDVRKIAREGGCDGPVVDELDVDAATD